LNSRASPSSLPHLSTTTIGVIQYLVILLEVNRCIQFLTPPTHSMFLSSYYTSHTPKLLFCCFRVVTDVHNIENCIAKCWTGLGFFWVLYVEQDVLMSPNPSAKLEDLVVVVCVYV